MAYLLLPILLILMYLMLLRPQQQRLRAQRQLVASLDVGDDIVTAGGIIGRIVDLSEQRATIEVADGVTIDFLRAAISRKADPALIGDPEDFEPEDTDINLTNGGPAGDDSGHDHQHENAEHPDRMGAGRPDHTGAERPDHTGAERPDHTDEDSH